MLLQRGNVITGDGQLLERTDLRIQEGHITERGVGLQVLPNEETYELEGKWVLPGLIDAHVHTLMSGGTDPYALVSRSDADLTIDAMRNAKRLLRAGFTTARDLGSRNFIDVDVRDAISQGRIEGSRLRVSGRCIIMTGGHGWFLGSRQADGADDCRKAAREQLFHGVDQLKTMATGGATTKEGEPGRPQLSQIEMAAVVEEAHKAGKKVAAHCHSIEGIRFAVDAGVDSIEHGSFADREILERMAKKGTVLCICMRATSIQANDTTIPAYMTERAKHILDAQLATCQLAHELGVSQVFGTDAGTPFNYHGENAKEFRFFRECGFSPMEALCSAMKSAADLIGLGNCLGTLDIGKIADILVLHTNPLEDIRVLEDPNQEIDLLMKEGQVVCSQ